MEAGNILDKGEKKIIDRLSTEVSDLKKQMKKDDESFKKLMNRWQDLNNQDNLLKEELLEFKKKEKKHQKLK